ncbi:hypothetical protein [Pseudolactococcus laudensis]|nr:hypothetical protein BN193_07210 [Lactococcus raffinolactis 4877]
MSFKIGDILAIKQADKTCLKSEDLSFFIAYNKDKAIKLDMTS